MDVNITGPVHHMQVNGDHASHNSLVVEPVRWSQLAVQLEEIGVGRDDVADLGDLLDRPNTPDRWQRILSWCQHTAAAISTGVTTAALTDLVQRGLT